MARARELSAARVGLVLGGLAQPALQLRQRQVEIVQQRGGGASLRDGAERHEHAAAHGGLGVGAQKPPVPQNELVLGHLRELLDEMNERGEDFENLEPGEVSAEQQILLNTMREQGEGQGGAGPSGSTSAGAASSSSSAALPPPQPPPLQPSSAAGPSGSQPSQQEDGLSDYELQRMGNIRANRQRLIELGLETPDGGAAAAPQGGGGGGGRRRAPRAQQASGPTAPSRRSARDRGAAAPLAYADHMNSDSDDDDDDFHESEAGVDDDDE